jgi:hypothetical protein
MCVYSLNGRTALERSNQEFSGRFLGGCALNNVVDDH